MSAPSIPTRQPTRPPIVVEFSHNECHEILRGITVFQEALTRSLEALPPEARRTAVLSLVPGGKVDGDA